MSTLQFDTVAQFHVNSHTTIHQLLHTIQNGAGLSHRVESLQGRKYAAGQKRPSTICC